MSQTTPDLTTYTTDEIISPKAWYQAASTQPDFLPDTAQASAIEELDVLWQQLIAFKSKRNQFLGRSLLSPEIPKGLYLWGGVGRGKTFLMDGFYACLPYRRKRRVHFHHFMAEVHHEMKRLSREKDPLMALATQIAEATRLLCLDEFHVDDIADAMILGRLITALFERGVVLITTSNYQPDDLYPQGLQRQNFLPAIALLKRELKVLNIDGGHDYRIHAIAREPLFLVSRNHDDDDANEYRMSTLFDKISSGKQQDINSITVLDRTFSVKKVARTAVWFEFKVLCGGAHDQSDYLEIAHRFPTLFLSHIPTMNAALSAEARRFTWLIDVLYDNNVRLIASAAADLENLYGDDLRAGEFLRTVSRLTEMQSDHYLKSPHFSQRKSSNLV